MGKQLGNFTFPKLSTAERDAIGIWTSGNAIYNTTVNEQQYYNGSIWITLDAGGGGTSLADVWAITTITNC